MSTNRELLETPEEKKSKIISLAESYADTVKVCNRTISKRAYLDCYMECIENEGMYADDITQRLSSAYSDLKVKHVELRHEVVCLRAELLQRKVQALSPVTEKKPMFKQIEITF